MSKWKKCKKLPITVEFREVEQDESGMETLEGYKPCSPDEHFIMRGVKGEIYPITKEIFHQTYEVVEE